MAVNLCQPMPLANQFIATRILACIAAFILARLQQFLVQIEFNARDALRRVGRENVDIENDAFNDALTMGRRQDPHLWYGGCWAGLRRGRGRAGEVAGDKPGKTEQQG